MLKITKGKYNKLIPYEAHLTKAYKGNYMLGLKSFEFDELYDIYRSMGGERRLTVSCSMCQMALLKELGRVYFEYKEKNDSNGN